MTIFELLKRLREQSIDEFDKGQRFERLVKAYLKIDPGWTEVFEEIWLWREFPDRPNDQDVGIDLVAKEKETGNLWAIQCKFYDEDTYLDKQHLGTFFAELGKNAYSAGLIVTTSNNWSNFAEQALKDQTKPVQRISLSDLDASPIDWASFSPEKPDVLQRTSKKVLRDHQMKALEAVKAGFEVEDRGKLIMACGTGKTFTSLKIAEEMLPAKGLVLFLVPSISLLSQSLREWTAETSRDLKSFAVCSDSKVGKNKNELEDIHSFDLAYPATTNAAKLVENFAIHTKGFNGLEVVFSTYQSLDVIAQAQREGLPEFDLIICDEAHRTTGATLSGEDESSFVRIHDKSYVKAVKRLYMTATPRVYADQAKAKAEENDAVLASMDDETLYGPEFHRLMFGEAVGLGLLSDYKVVVLTVPEDRVATLMAGGRGSALDLPLDDVARIIGCYNGLSKRSGNGVDFAADPAPMMRAVAFARSIKDSKAFAEALPGVVNSLLLDENDSESLRTTAHHVDGTFNVLRRNHELEWLKAPGRPGEVRVLSNARCLAEGVDVPALDAVLFLNPRNSVVDVVQSVGRVMRKNEGKQYGYIIIPIAVPDFEDPKRALDENKRFKTVWQVLQALRSHDERFSAMVNKIDLNKKLDEHLIFAGDDVVADENVGADDKAKQLVFSMMDSEAWRDVVLAKLVSKVGERTYWEDWANDVALIAGRHVTRIEAILDNPNSEVSKKFDQFLHGLRANLNNSITSDDAIEMLSQHLITKPVFDALFSDYSFAEHNPVSIVMQEMVEALDEQGLETESESLEKFYESVRMRVQGIDNAEGRQRIITELYEKFFRGAFKKTTESLGIVYTPIEIVDFIIASVQTALGQEFGASLSDEGVHVLDPFTGTGTFIVRLLQSGAITPDALIRKYTSELHANEIVLLAYYIAAINVEAVFHEIAQGEYKPFEGIVLTDTFQMAEVRATDDIFFPDNNARARRQREIDIRVIVGNPPYSVGQTSQNDNNQNLAYPTLDGRIESTYAAQSSAGLVRNLYDSYIRAFRWASDRIGDSGVVCFVSNGAYIDSGSADGFRKTLAAEFSSIYCLNLRGNQRTAGETSRREGGKIFGGGSRTPIAITLLVRNPRHLDSCQLHYHDIGDYLSREEKLAKVAQFGNTAGIEWEDLTPDESGDWINQRSEIFETFSPLGDKKSSHTASLFGADYSLGVVTNRDAWAHNFSFDVVAENMERTIGFYNGQVESFKESRRGIPSKASSQDVDAFVDNDRTKISWTRGLKNDLRLGKVSRFNGSSIVKSAYRPFTKQWLYFDRQWNEMVLLFPRIYPDSSVSNLTIAVSGMGSGAGYSVLMTDEIPSLTLPGAGNAVQCFPMYVYDQVVEENGDSLFSQQDMGDASIFKTPKGTYRRRNAITDTTLAEYRHKIGQEVTKEDIFYYVYGVLHSPEYTTRFAAELGKMIPRIPISTNFWEFSKAGRSLGDLHLNYETVQPWSLDGMPADGARAGELRVEKMRFPRNGTEKDRSKIIVNSHITLSGIPDEAYDYMVNGKSAIEWIIDRYQVKTDKDSGIVNDPNLWSDVPRYIVDLLARIVRVSVESAVIISNLPQLRI